MNIKFQKYQGAGNDFIIIDNCNQLYGFSPQIVEALCDRKFGIGADGLMLLEAADKYDFRMRYFYSDGKHSIQLKGSARSVFRGEITIGEP